jgi:hypothetical protein
MTFAQFLAEKAPAFAPVVAKPPKLPKAPKVGGSVKPKAGVYKLLGLKKPKLPAPPKMQAGPWKPKKSKPLVKKMGKKLPSLPNVARRGFRNFLHNTLGLPKVKAL